MKNETLELVQLFNKTWIFLDAFDKSVFPSAGISHDRVLFTAGELMDALMILRTELIAQNIAADVFGTARSPEGVEGIVGNVFQSFGGKDVYPTLEEKAAHLLYFIVKNHPFVDGNKRSGAFAFVWFLKSAKLLDSSRLTPEALTALTLLVAESKPSHKERIIGLVLLLLPGKFYIKR